MESALTREGSRDLLRETVEWSDEWNDPESGLPDLEKIGTAVEQVAETRPWLARVRGDVGQGLRGQDSDSVDLASLLRAGA